MIKKVYKKWVTEVGDCMELDLTTYVGVVKNGKSVRKVEHKGIMYVGEIWEDKDGNEYIVRAIYDDVMHEVDNDVGWNYTKLSEALRDDLPNSHVDDIQYILNGKTDLYENWQKIYPNHHLEEFAVKHEITKHFLKKLIKEKPELREVIDLKLKLMCEPELKYYKYWVNNEIIKGRKIIDITIQKKELITLLKSNL